MSNREPIEIVEIDIDYCPYYFGRIEPSTTPDLYKYDGSTISNSELNVSGSYCIVADVQFDGTAPDGILWEQGGSGAGVYLGVTSGELVFRAGAGGTLPQDTCAMVRVDVTHMIGLACHIIAEILPGDDAVRLRVIGDDKVKYVDEIGVAPSGMLVPWAGAGSGGAIGTVAGNYPLGESGTDWNGTITDVLFWEGLFTDVGCPASLGGQTERKCFNTFFTCKVQEFFSTGSKTYRFTSPRSNYPKGATTFPCLVSVDGSSAKANIAAADPKMYGLGERGKITATFTDFPYHDRFNDKYQSERISGAAQLSGVGYNPAANGTFWGRFKARNPNYSGRPMRKLSGYIQDGVLTIEKTRHYVITEMKGPDTSGRVTITGKDVLKLADDDRAVAPAQSVGKLGTDITDAVGQSFDLTPAGIGDSDYPASGLAAIGNEIVEYTRSGDTVTVTTRGVSGTDAATHSAEDTFQVTYSPRRQRIDDVIYDLLVNYASIDASYIPVSEWRGEVDRWASSLLLTTDILKPEGVAKLIGEIAELGVTIWWDDVTQKINLRMNRPVDTETVLTVTDDNAIISAEQEDRDEDRVTDVLINTVQIDPSQGTKEENFRRGTVISSALEKLPQAYGDTRIKTINCRWLNHGDNANVRIIALRLLDRFRNAPIRMVVTLDWKDDSAIADVIDMRSSIVPSDTGELQRFLSQVIMREDVVDGHKLRLTLQRFPFDKRYGFITEDTRPTYTLSTDVQRSRGAYFVDETTLEFSDGTGPFRII